MKKVVDNRPWGNFEQFTLNEKSTVKILTFKAGKRNSLQKHKNRKEFWKLLDNPARITIGKKIINGKKGDEFAVPKNTFHRIQAYSKPARVLEISLGNFKENDIIRVEDDFGRIKKEK